MIDAYGRILPGAELGFGKMAVIDVRLPTALPDTPFSNLGEWPFAVFMTLSLLTIGVGILSRRPR
jgi:apolipoprotein N-acyltransferase